MAGESQQVPSSRADPTVLTTEQLMREVNHIHDLMKAHKETVETHFTLMENQRIELKADTTKAVEAALDAAKAAVSAVEKTVDDVKERVVKLETASQGERRMVERVQDRTQPFQIWALGAVMTVVVLLANGKLG